MLKAVLAGSHRYGLATMAPIAVSAAHFLLQMSLLRVVDKAEFGLLALVLGFIQFGFGFSNALVSTPYTLEVNDDRAERGSKAVYFKLNALFSAFWGLCCAALAISFGYAGECWIFGAFGFLAMVRWFGRAHLYAMHRPAQAAISDFVYAAVLLAGIGVASISRLSFDTALLLLASASLIGALAVGREFLELQFRRASRASLRPYATVWREQARWSLLGVISSEATSNSHSYVVSIVDGPAAFAPLAAASLLIKPVMLVITSLTQLERPVMARQISARDRDGARRSLSVFRIAVLSAWLATMLGALLVMTWLPHLVFKPTYDLRIVMLAFALMSVITLLQCWSAPASVLLQAADRFRPLSLVNMTSAAVAIATVVMIAALLPPAFSLFGILIGQLMTNAGIAVVLRRWAGDTSVERPAQALNAI